MDGYQRDEKKGSEMNWKNMYQNKGKHKKMEGKGIN
jgi:hypothetical protein